MSKNKAALSFEDFLCTDADTDENTTEALTTKVSSSSSSSPEQSGHVDDAEDLEAPVPTISLVMDAIDLLRRLAGAHEETEDALQVLVRYESV